MNGRGKSDGCVVPEKPPNKDAAASAEAVEERHPAKENSSKQNRSRARIRQDLQSALERVRQAAKRDRKQKFTTLWHHVYDVDRLREAYCALTPKAAPGVDGETWQQYGENLEESLADLSARLKRGAYRAKPVRRVYIPKADGQQRPIGVPTLEDKIVQRASVEVLNAVYETDFLGFSYGFRRGRGQHNALDAIAVGIQRRKVSWVLDVDIRGFFDAINHEWLIQFLEHRIADRRVLRHVKKWLNAGVLEKGEWSQSKQGTPQGGSISPLLANVYLHYVFDLWAQQWRQRNARGDVVIVRYADDIVVGFQHREEAESFMSNLVDRFAEFGLELHSEKTRLVEFGRFAAERRRKRGLGKPETFNFLGFTHICGKTRDGRFALLRTTMRTRLRRKLKELGAELMRRRHWSLLDVGMWLRQVLLGHYRYYGVPRNYPAMSAFRQAVTRLWYRALCRRSQRRRNLWSRVAGLASRWLPQPRIMHPHPDQRLLV